MECQGAHWKDHRLLCQAIGHLSSRDSKEFRDPTCVSHLTPREHAKVIGLVGKKCIVKCLLNDCEFELLWDTGAQVSIISLAAIQQHLVVRTAGHELEFDSSEWDQDPLHWVGGSQTKVNPF